MENKTMNKRVYGILGISSIMGNWNADFQVIQNQQVMVMYLVVIKP